MKGHSEGCGFDRGRNEDTGDFRITDADAFGSRPSLKNALVPSW